MNTVDKARALLAQVLHKSDSQLHTSPNPPTPGQIPEVEGIPKESELHGEQRLSDLFRETPFRRVRSRVLGEDVLFAADDAEVGVESNLVVYRTHELAQLVGRPPEQIRKIHLLKKGFDGEMLGMPDLYPM